MLESKGFITIATGKEEYYEIAYNLLKSYKANTASPLPFAILCDRENEYTRHFDDVIILQSPFFSYLDKINLLNHIPYQETIFIESDCLIYDDVNLLFDLFKNATDFSIIGKENPLDGNRGWFKITEAGKYAENISFIPSFHSGFFFMRNTSDVCRTMYDICMDIFNHYENYNIGGNRKTLDDKLLAVSMASTSCRTVKDQGHKICIYCKNRLRINMYKKILLCKSPQSGLWEQSYICHFGSSRTKSAIYRREIRNLNMLLNNPFNKLGRHILYEWLYYIGFVNEKICHLFCVMQKYIKAHKKAK